MRMTSTHPATEIRAAEVTITAANFIFLARSLLAQSHLGWIWKLVTNHTNHNKCGGGGRTIMLLVSAADISATFRISTPPTLSLMLLG